MKLSEEQANILRDLIGGSTLKVHRYLDGEKIHRLHPLDGPPETVPKAIVESLKQRLLIESNKKFPAATYLLTDKGRSIAVTLTGTKTRPLSAQNYSR